MITPWPSNGSASASTSPLFMMIPYPSSSPLPVNVTVINEPFDVIGTVVSGIAIGTLSISSLFLLYQYLKSRQISKGNDNKNKEDDPTSIKIRLNNGLSYICVDSNEIEDIKKLLIINSVRFRIINEL
jgi:hypothetical protein